MDQQTVMSRLRELGADSYDLALPETHSLAGLLERGEVIEGIVYGRYRTAGGMRGRGALVATDRRVILVDHKPLSLSASEISYQVISGISRGTTTIVSTVVVNTRMGDVRLRTFNPRAADTFVHTIERHIFEGPADFRPISPHDENTPE